MNQNKQEYVVNRTIELYKSLPMDKEQRMNQYSVRDEIIQLNYKFFGYVASNTYVDNTTYDDKLQTALMSFLGMWWKYMWTPKYRDDLAFSVFFKPRIAEEIRRYLGTTSYTTKRALCMKAAKQLGKPWQDVCYDDLDRCNLPASELTTLQSIMCASHQLDLSECEFLVFTDEHTSSPEKYLTDRYDTIEELLIHEMVENESQLTDANLHAMSDMYSIDIDTLREKLPIALNMLHDRLVNGQLNEIQ